MPDIALPFTMDAAIKYGAAPLPASADDPMPPGWVRIPVALQITLPAGFADQAATTPPSGSSR